jgi:hypothetical protein
MGRGILSTLGAVCEIDRTYGTVLTLLDLPMKR